MGGINLKRVLGGGAAAGALMWVLEGAGALLYMEEMEAALAAHGLSMEMSAGIWATTVLVTLLLGLVLVFLYAAARPRFGPGPKTAVIVAVAVFLSGYFLSLIGYGMIGLYPTSMLVLWGVVGLAEMVLGTLLGGWLYREGPAGAAAGPRADEPGEPAPGGTSGASGHRPPSP